MKSLRLRLPLIFLGLLIVWIGASTSGRYSSFAVGEESGLGEYNLNEEEVDWTGYEWSVPDVDKSLKRALWGMDAVSIIRILRVLKSNKVH